MAEFGEAMEEMTDGDFKSKDASVVGDGGMEISGGGGGGRRGGGLRQLSVATTLREAGFWVTLRTFPKESNLLM